MIDGAVVELFGTNALYLLVGWCSAFVVMNVVVIVRSGSIEELVIGTNTADSQSQGRRL